MFFSMLRQLSKSPFFRSENLLLEYKNGDECLDTNGSIKRSTLIHFVCDASVSGQVRKRERRWRWICQLVPKEKQREMIVTCSTVFLLKNRASQCWWPTTTNATSGLSGALPRPALLTSQRATTAVESLVPCEFAKTNPKICSVHEDHTNNGHREKFLTYFKSFDKLV